MPTIIFLAIAFQLQNKNWRYFFLFLAAANIIVNIFIGRWTLDFYAAVSAFLLCLLTPKFLPWWQQRDSRGVLSGNWAAIIKHLFDQKFEILFWAAAFVIVWVAIYAYWDFTGHIILGWIAGLCVSVYIVKKFLVAIIPPQFIFQEKSTRYVGLVVLISWIASVLIYRDLNGHFVMPTIIALLLGLGGMYLVRGNTRFLVPGCALVLADLFWQIIRFIRNNDLFTYQVLSSEIIIVVAMLIGVAWMFKKPGVLPIVFLMLFQLFRFSAFTYQAIDRASVATLTTPEVTFYMVYLVCWMFITPMVLLFVGTWQSKKGPEPQSA